MSKKTVNSQALRKKRHHRVRKTVVGTAERPRLAVFRSNRHIVAQIVDAHGGTVDVISAPGEGTTVTVRLPLAAPGSQD